MKLYSQLIFPHLLEWIMSRPGMMQLRYKLLADIHGKVLEIGFGTGLNLLAYPSKDLELTTLDVNPAMQTRAQKRVKHFPLPVQHHTLDGASLPFADAQFDAVVSTWTLCSIPRVDEALLEMYRVIKPGGRLYFVEHGLDPKPGIARWQHRLTPLQKRIGDGCHLNREPLKLIQQAGFHLERHEHTRVHDLPRLGHFMSLGTAIKPA